MPQQGTYPTSIPDPDDLVLGLADGVTNNFPNAVLGAPVANGSEAASPTPAGGHWTHTFEVPITVPAGMKVRLEVTVVYNDTTVGGISGAGTTLLASVDGVAQGNAGLDPTKYGGFSPLLQFIPPVLDQGAADTFDPGTSDASFVQGGPVAFGPVGTDPEIRWANAHLDCVLDPGVGAFTIGVFYVGDGGVAPFVRTDVMLSLVPASLATTAEP